jgi:DNA-binding NarL/FixJ family response regulator
MATTHIVIADSSSLAVVGAEVLLLQRADTRVSIASCASELVRIARALQPDIVLAGDQLDPTLDAFALVEQLTRSAPYARILLVGNLTDGLLIRDLVAAGVRGYLYAGDDLRTDLFTALDTVLRNRPYLSPTADAEYLIAMQSGERDWKLDAEARSVLRLLARGCTIGSIAAQLQINPRRVYWVREKLRRRFGATTNEHLISRAAAEGFSRFAD